MNINVKDSTYKDPFAQSDRGGLGHDAGKGDSPRNNASAAFKKHFDEIPNMGKARGFGRFRKTYR